MITIYGIRNCDTVKKSLQWFDDNRIAYNFHDFKKQGLDELTLKDWLGNWGWETVVNRKGTTWRKLGLTVESMSSPDNACSLIHQNLSLIRRPVVFSPESGSISFGYDPGRWVVIADSRPGDGL